MGKIYIHYGSDEFKLEKFKPIKNVLLSVKPKGGLWASPIDAKLGWKKWCEENKIQFAKFDKSFTFVLKPETRLLFIDDAKQLEDLPKVKNPAIFENFNLWACLDFEQLSKEYDAIEITLSEEKSHNNEFWGGLYDKLYGWDCDSICIMNPDCIEVNPRITVEPIIEQKPEEPRDTYKQYVCKGYKIKINDEILQRSESQNQF